MFVFLEVNDTLLGDNDIHFYIVRLGGDFVEQLQVVAYSYLYGLGLAQQFIVIAFSPAQPIPPPDPASMNPSWGRV